MSDPKKFLDSIEHCIQCDIGLYPALDEDAPRLCDQCQLNPPHCYSCGSVSELGNRITPWICTNLECHVTKRLNRILSCSICGDNVESPMLHSSDKVWCAGCVTAAKNAPPPPSDTGAELAIEDISQPTRWHLLPRPTPEEFAAAMLDMLRTASGQKIMNGLIHQYLLAEVPDDANMIRYVGRQDVVKPMMEISLLGVQQRQQRQRVNPNGNEWFASI